MAQPDDQRDSRGRDRPRLAVRPPGPRLKRCLAFDLVTGQQLTDPGPSHPIGADTSWTERPSTTTAVITKRAFDTPETQAGPCPVCLATPVRYVMKQDTVGATSAMTGAARR